MPNTIHSIPEASDTECQINCIQLISDTLSESPTPTQYHGTEVLEANCAALIAAQRDVIAAVGTPAYLPKQMIRRAVLTQLIKDQIWGDIVVDIAREQGWIITGG